jgi:hypothetical protein
MGDKEIYNNGEKETKMLYQFITYKLNFKLLNTIISLLIMSITMTNKINVRPR